MAGGMRTGGEPQRLGGNALAQGEGISATQSSELPNQCVAPGASLRSPVCGAQRATSHSHSASSLARLSRHEYRASSATAATGSSSRRSRVQVPQSSAACRPMPPAARSRGLRDKEGYARGPLQP